jgi:hypothetical protein
VCSSDLTGVGFFDFAHGQTGASPNQREIHPILSMSLYTPGVTLTLTALIQGLFNGTSMIPDTVTVELHGASSPYALVESTKGVLNSSGVGTFNFKTAINQTPYYIVIKPRNGIETWGASTNTFSSSTLSYNLTSSQNQAFGSNLILKGTKWCIYSGDITQDGQVSFSDLIAVDNDNNNYVNGYTKTDLTGDNQVTFSDLIIVDNNNSSYVARMYPTGTTYIDSYKQLLRTEENSIIIGN